MLNITMRGTITIVFSALLSLITLAQDTIRVQTLTYDSITTRRGTWVFPDSTHSFRKVLMSYKLKCDPQTTADGFDCGEWDYLTYSNVYEHTGVLDSAELEHPFFLVGNDDPDSLEVVNSPLYDSHQWYAYERVIDMASGEVDHPVGGGGSSDNMTLNNANGSSRTQLLITSAEMGMIGTVEQIRFDLSQAGDSISRLRISADHHTGGPFNTLNSMLTLYEGPFTPQVGTNTITLTQPFVWNGTQDVVLEIAFSEPQGSTPSILTATDLGTAGSLIRASGQGSYVDLNDDHIGVVADGFQNVTDEVTVMCWIYGDPALQPQNNYTFEGVNSDNQRVLNVHLPWSDGRVYWDAGQDGGYDRIDKAAATNEYEGRWNHWAFTKNSTTGSMQIYLNGALWHTGSGKTRPMVGIEKFVIGASRNHAGNYAGGMDEFAVFNKALDANGIQEAYEGLTALHPSYADLLYLFRFDEAGTEFRIENEADPTMPGWLMGTVQRVKDVKLSDVDQLATVVSSTIRPDITFVTGTYTTHMDSALMTTQRIHAGAAKEDFQVNGNFAVPIDTVFGWQAAEELTYDPSGNVITQMPASGTLYLNDTLEYFGEPFEVVNNYEIGRFITPYGINLSLGPNGFQWMYDVTDYQFLLHDSVELSAGNNQELIDLEFIMIEGSPPREVVNVQRPWGERRSMLYRDLDDDTQLPPIMVDLDPNADQWMIRTRLTGHGHNSNTGNYPHCCEWKDNTHSMHANGSLVKDWHIWQTHDCGLNPVFPQGGTWPGAREGWCPGDVVKDNDIELTDQVTGNTIELDYQITPVPANNQGMGSGNYVVAMQLFEFGQPAHNLDAEIYEVKRPTEWEYRDRINPICQEPLVTLRNAGGTELTSVTFTYGVSGGQHETYTWNGNLKHMEVVDVPLPLTSATFWQGDEDRMFTVSVSAPNGGTDEQADNNSYTTHFELPDVYEEGVVIWLITNNAPQENAYTVKDLAGNTVLSRSGMQANTIYTDTLTGPHDCYVFELTDSDDDGLSYWANTAQGNGLLQFRSPNGGIFKTFESEFGHSIVEEFAIGWVVSDGSIDPMPISANVFPNPNAGEFTLQVQGITDLVTMRVIDALGREIMTKELTVLGELTLPIDLGAYPAGTYTVHLSSDELVRTLPVVKY